MALSDRNGEITFYQSGGLYNEKQAKVMPEGYDLSGSIRKPNDTLIAYPGLTFDNTIKVKTSTLDTWCEEHKIENIDFIWLDVQGAEMDVFRGGENTLRKTRFIYTEYSNRELYEGQPSLKQILKYLSYYNVLVRYLGYVLLWNTQLELLPKRIRKRMHNILND